MPKRPLRRGFKAEAEEYALDFRTELGMRGLFVPRLRMTVGLLRLD
jgi:hypothetical protein